MPAFKVERLQRRSERRRQTGETAPVLLPPAGNMWVNSDGMCYPWVKREGAGNEKVAYSVAFPHPRRAHGQYGH